MKTILRLNKINFPELYMNIYFGKNCHMFKNKEISKFGNMYLEVKPKYKNFIQKEFKNHNDFVTLFTNEKEFSRIHIRNGTIDQF